ncbi:hypothetical protein MIMGU_mgv1a003517mg [Erythranthe guttata]|uniref:Uncharacterized protein n=1 Tax=Erythranthe guttata TaxID=4155 RepID=A0A022Q385_ERYGU|nr:hypothetical protein MIMGU_mgv1a003517mg [Erythranthe guttata]
MAQSTPILLGPPEIYQQIGAAAATGNTETDPFVDLMVANFNTTKLYSPPMGLTENFSPTFLSTVRGTGKSDKEGYYTAVLWLHKHHPKTLACNVASIAEFGYFKDLPEILFRLLEGADARKLAKESWESRKGVKRGRRSLRGRFSSRGRFTAAAAVGKSDVTDSKLSREEKKIERAKRVVDRFNRDPDFKFLHDRVSNFFARCLRSDMILLNSGDLYKISLAAKWCPSLDSSFDKYTLLCETIAKKVFPREEYPEYEGVEEAHYAYRVRDRLRKEVIVPLRKALELPESFIGANDWGSIPYNRVASVAMKFYKEKFLKHDKERFQEYLEKVKSGEAKIAAGALLPHEIISALEHGDGGQVAELQWKRMVDDMGKKGKMNNCLAICDVSGSMSGIPMEVSVALGVLVSELSESPWKGKLITFSENPMLQSVEGESLREKTEFVRNMDWGMNTDFQKVFDLLLKVAVDGRLKADQMIKRLFVFSDMEFDQASGTPWETDYEAIVRKFKERGYGECVPEIVFWNLRDSMATPVPGNQPGVALVSGFSKNLMKLFLEDGGVLNPEAVMDAAISGEEYQNLVVLD